MFEGKQLAKGVSALMSLVLAVGLMPLPAFAAGGGALAAATAPLGTQADAVQEGESGTCTWTLDSAGLLTVRPTTGDEGTLGEWSGSDGAPWYEYRESIKAARFEGTVKAITCEDMFFEASSLTSLDLTGLDTSHVTDMSGMFMVCPSLTSLDLSGLDTSHVENMRAMFWGLTSLQSLDLSVLDTSHVTDMFAMFYDCSLLTSLDFSGLDTSNLTNMYAMFTNCPSLTSLDFSGLDTSHVTNMGFMFGCASLTYLDLSSFDTSHVTHMDSMFAYCPSLKTICVGDKWSTANVTSSEGMFSGCESLVGGVGTVFDAGHVDAAYARVDKAGAPGYLTGKGAASAKKSIAGAAVGLSKTSYTFNGKQKCPAVSVALGGAALKEGTDYEVSYSGNVSAGTATATVRGLGSYEGAAHTTFKIKKAANPLRASAEKRTVKASSLVSSAYRFASVSVSKARGKVTYSRAGGSKCLVLDKGSGAVTVKAGTPKGAYKLKVKARAAGDANHKAGVRTVTVKVRVK